MAIVTVFSEVNNQSITYLKSSRDSAIGEDLCEDLFSENDDLEQFVVHL